MNAEPNILIDTTGVAGSGTVKYEPFIAEFTGKLITFQTRDNRRMTLKSAVSVVKGMGYMLMYNSGTGQGRVLPVVPS